MQPKGYIDWLFSEDKKPYYVGASGIVQEGDKDTLLKPDGQPAHLQNSPDGWKDTLVKYGRNLTYLGLFREMTVPMRFTKDGAKILRYVNWNKGQEGIVYFAKHKLNRLAYPHQYDAWFMGEIDLSKFRQRQQDRTVTVNVMEGGLSKLLKAHESTSYDIRIDTDVSKKVLYLDGVPFTNKVEFLVLKGQDILASAFVLEQSIVTNEGTTQGVLVQDVRYGPTAAFPNESWFIWSIDKNITVTVSGKLKAVCYDGGGNTFDAAIQRVSDQTNTVYQSYSLFSGSGYNPGDVIEFPFSQVINMSRRQRLHMRVNAGGPGDSKFYIDGFNISLEYNVTFTPSFCECLTPLTLFERHVEKLTDGKYGVKSTFLQSLDDILYTSGTALRKYMATSSIKSALQDLFRELKLRGRKKLSIALAIENDQVVIEELDYFFRPEIIMDLGIVDDLEIVEAEDMQINTIKVGYKNQEIDKVNGRDEFNVTQTRTTPHTRIVKELDLVSPYRADMYGIEVTRIDLNGKDTTDNKADNDTFVLSVEKPSSVTAQYYSGVFDVYVSLGQYYIKIPSVLFQIANGGSIIISGSTSNNGTYTIVNTSYIVVDYTIIQVSQPVTNETVDGILSFISTDMYILKRPAYSPISGLLHPDESFNIELSPKRCLDNNGGFLHSLLYKQDINKIVFQTGEKNSELSTTLAGVTVTEKEDVVIGSLPDPLFLPYYFTFTTNVQADFLSIIKATPYGKIKFTDGKTGLVLYGYLWDGGIKPEPNDKQTWKLISAVQDLTQLI